jgi:hypothetical protein
MSALTKRGRGRPKGTTSVWRNAANVAAHHASVLFELWLAGVSVQEARAFLGLPTGHTRELLFECWAERGNGPQHQVPLEIKQKLCELAIAHVVELQRQTQDAKREIEAILQRCAEAAEAKLKAQGWTDEQVAAWFNSAAPKRDAKDFKTPNVKQVLGIVARHAPPGTLRYRKKAVAPDSPEIALREYEEQLQNASRAEPEIPTAKSRKKARDCAQAKARRAARGAKSRAESATRPWEAEGISRRTWERRQKAATATLTQNVVSTQK